MFLRANFGLFDRILISPLLSEMSLLATIGGSGSSGIISSSWNILSSLYSLQSSGRLEIILALVRFFFFSISLSSFTLFFFLIFDLFLVINSFSLLTLLCNLLLFPNFNSNSLLKLFLSFLNFFSSFLLSISFFFIKNSSVSSSFADLLVIINFFTSFFTSPVDSSCFTIFSSHVVLSSASIVSTHFSLSELSTQ